MLAPVMNIVNKRKKTKNDAIERHFGAGEIERDNL